MPRHDYRCLSCGYEFEFFKVRSDERVECPNCKERDEKKLERKVSTATGFALKGKGWFRDGY